MNFFQTEFEQYHARITNSSHSKCRVKIVFLIYFLGSPQIAMIEHHHITPHALAPNKIQGCGH